MSVQGTILVLDGVSTNRIMLKVQLTAAWYHVVQGERLRGLPTLLRRSQPDLVLAAQTLPDGKAADVKKLLAGDPTLADIPVVAITQQNDKAARIQALADGLDDVLAYPFKDTLLLAHVRSLLRIRGKQQELRINDEPKSIGFAEPQTAFYKPPPAGLVALLAHSTRTNSIWRKALSKQMPNSISTHTLPNLKGILSAPAPDAIVVELGPGAAGQTILSDLRSRATTRHSALIGVMQGDNADLAAEALDWGADAVCQGGFETDEIVLRLKRHIARKQTDDKLRASLRKGLTDSLTDALTGLHNRRFAMSALDQIARKSLNSGRSFAVMVADLDHFKSINDRFGHSVGDLVLTEVAGRLQRTVEKAGFVARIGGEEFLICIPDVPQENALETADLICDRICAEPFRLPDSQLSIPVTISIGLRLCEPWSLNRSGSPFLAGDLLKSADIALYAAKKAGRNQVQIRPDAA
ncbi:diguanylate cyclase [Ruegeria arenilitoris]|uniref:diguanylate cyclase n=1 Tax=Ruegeria arenilitoris TaxID=1173585 RepID=UPI00147FB6FE|nr:diguanylate cyclase [Ruegeria arenilitoris]